VVEDADYVIDVKPETDCDVYNSTAAANPLCATFTLQTGEYSYGSIIVKLIGVGWLPYVAHRRGFDAG